MQVFRKAATDHSPEVLLDPSGKIELSGRSIPENAATFYFPILDWLQEYCEQPAPRTEFILFLEYINSISQKMILDILSKAGEIQSKGHEINIVWFYDEEDEEIKEEGEIFRDKLKLPIEVRVR